MRSLLVIGLTLGINGVFCLDCPAGDPAKDSRETARFVAVGTVRGMTVPALVADQHLKALANWKRLFTAETPANFESPHFLLYGTVPGKELKDIAPGLEKQFALALKTLEMETEEIWPGKMAVFFWNERRHYTGFVRVVEKRKADEDETGCFDIERENAHVIVGPSDSNIDLNVGARAGEQAAAALLTKKTKGANVPSWIIGAFGRATAFRAVGFKDLAFEHRRAQVLALQKKKSFKQAVGSGLTEEEAAVVRASMVEYLAYSGKTTKFLPILNGFRPTEAMAEPTLDAALKSANLSVDRLDQAWLTWLKSLK